MIRDIRDDDIADTVISGKLKKAESYHADYGGKTYGEMKQLAKAGDRNARQMKKLMEQGKRLREKLRRRLR